MEQSAFFMLEEEANEEEMDDEEETTALAVGIVTAGAEYSRQHRANQRNPSRLYLTRAQLLPHPRVDTPWQHLYTSHHDRAFITTMGFDVSTFDAILAAGFGQLWTDTPINRTDADAGGDPRP